VVEYGLSIHKALGSNFSTLYKKKGKEKTKKCKNTHHGTSKRSSYFLKIFIYY
jgi:hypothetical protein